MGDFDDFLLDTIKVRKFKMLPLEGTRKDEYFALANFMMNYEINRYIYPLL